MFKKLFSLFSKSLAMDLGTANTLVYTKKDGIILNEPSVVALDAERGSVLAVGREAKEFIGRTPHRIKAIRPLRDGVIADFDVTSKLIEYFIRKVVRGLSFSRPRIVICVPTGITQVEKRAVIEAARHSGSGDVFLIEEPMAAAIGAGLPISEPKGCMIIDIGGGTSEVSVISLGGIVVTSALRTAGKDMDNAIVAMLRQRYALYIGETTAEEVKNTIGSALPLSPELEMSVKGRDLTDGLPKIDTVSSVEVREALDPIFLRIEDMIKVALEKTPPELAKDIVDQGVVLSGGVALMKGLAERFSRAINTPVIVAENPAFAVAFGVGKILDNLSTMKRVLMSVERGAR